MSLTEDERTRYTAFLASAEAAYNTLMMGGSVAEFKDQNGESVRYKAADSAALYAHINRLRSALGMCPFLGGGSRPAGVIF